MKNFFLRVSMAGAVLIALATNATAEDAKEAAMQKDRKLIEGTWRVVSLEVNGNRASDEDARKLRVINGSDGTWSLRSGDKEIVKGVSTFDATKTPKTIDFAPSDGENKDRLHLGIYELGETKRKVCFAGPDHDRPTEFSAAAGSGCILVTFEREAAK